MASGHEVLVHPNSDNASFVSLSVTFALVVDVPYSQQPQKWPSIFISPLWPKGCVLASIPLKQLHHCLIISLNDQRLVGDVAVHLKNKMQVAAKSTTVNHADRVWFVRLLKVKMI